MAQILIVDDEPHIVELASLYLKNDGFSTLHAQSGAQALQMIKEYHPDLVVLDIMLPELDGWEVSRRLRQEGDNVPIIMLTARAEDVDKIVGLELGADDYVTKPFSLRELLARVNALLRRSSENMSEINQFSIGDTLFDLKKCKALKKGKEIEYTTLELQMVKLFYEKREQAVNRTDFLDRIWGEKNTLVTERTVDSHIANIRKKLEDDPSDPRYIISVRGVGYKLVL